MEKFKTTCAIVVNDKNQILLIKRGREPYKGYWSLVSGIGASKKGLPLGKAVLEEVEWDLGTKFINSKRIFSMPAKENEFTDEVIVFTGNIEKSEIKMHPGFSEDFKWVSLTDKPSFEELAFEHTEIIKEHMKNIQ